TMIAAMTTPIINMGSSHHRAAGARATAVAMAMVTLRAVAPALAQLMLVVVLDPMDTEAVCLVVTDPSRDQDMSTHSICSKPLCRRHRTQGPARRFRAWCHRVSWPLLRRR